MVWKQPNDDQKGQDPWNHKETKLDKINKNNKNSCAIKEFNNLFKFLKNCYKNFSSKHRISKTAQNPIIIIFIILVIFFVTSGFYTIKEAERGVITYCGQFSHLVKPGLNWRPLLLSTITPINVQEVKEVMSSGIILTADENFIQTEINVQYRITNPRQYLFSVIGIENSLQQVVDSALRTIIGHFTLDHILMEGHALISTDLKKEIEVIIAPYNMGITILDVNFQKLCPPEVVKKFFNKVILAKEHRKNYIKSAELYANKVISAANGQKKRILEKAKMHRLKLILKSEGEIVKFLKILPIYKSSKTIVSKRLYLESMEKIFNHTSKILISSNNNNKILFLLDKSILNKQISLQSRHSSHSSKKNILYSMPTLNKDNNFVVDSTSKHKNIMEQRKLHAFRINNLREGRKLNNE